MFSADNLRVYWFLPVQVNKSLKPSKQGDHEIKWEDFFNHGIVAGVHLFICSGIEPGEFCYGRDAWFFRHRFQSVSQD